MSNPDPTSLPRRLNRLSPLHWLLLASVALALFLPGFFTIPPFDRDESRYAQATHQMLETGDFVDIRYQNEARHKKPVGIYWLQSASVSLLSGGETHGPIWMYRVPSLLGAVAAVLLTAWTAVRLFGATAGFAAGLAMASCLILGVEARMAKTDAVLLATIIAAQGCLLRVWLDRLKPLLPPLPLIIGFWVAVGLSILVKGPLILMVTGGTLLMLWAMDREIAWVRRLRPRLGLAILAVIVLPWAVAIAVETGGAFFSYAIGHEFLGKAQVAQEKHWGPPGYYLATFWLTFWPWSLPAALALPWVWAQRREPSVRFCLAWIIPSWLIFEAVPTKLPHYTILLFPAIASLTAAAALDRFAAAERRFGIGRSLVAGLFVIISLAFAGGAVWAPLSMGESLMPTAILTGLAIVGTALAVVALESRREGGRLLLAGTAGAFVSLGLAQGLVLPNIDSMWISPRVQAAYLKNRPCPDTILAASGYTEPSMVFLIGTKTVLGGPEQVADAMADNPACGLGMLASGQDDYAFLAQMTARNLPVIQVDTVEGFNYSRGRPVTLNFYRVAGATVETPEPAAAPPEAGPPALPPTEPPVTTPPATPPAPAN
jgi:4-amino-4-deoxy-L-arabinose transferase-like glycosyltransferase